MLKTVLSLTIFISSIIVPTNLLLAQTMYDWPDQHYQYGLGDQQFQIHIDDHNSTCENRPTPADREAALSDCDTECEAWGFYDTWWEHCDGYLAPDAISATCIDVVPGLSSRVTYQCKCLCRRPL